MKKVIALALFAALACFIACGGGKAKEKEQKRLDSLRLDSIKKAKEADSLAAVEKELLRIEDSTRIADSISKAEKKNQPKDKKPPKKKHLVKKPVKKKEGATKK